MKKLYFFITIALLTLSMSSFGYTLNCSKGYQLEQKGSNVSCKMAVNSYKTIYKKGKCRRKFKLQKQGSIYQCIKKKRRKTKILNFKCKGRGWKADKSRGKCGKSVKKTSFKYSKPFIK